MVSATPLRLTEDLALVLQETLNLSPDVMEALEESGEDIFNASIEDLADIKGVGAAIAFGIHTLLEKFKGGQGVESQKPPTVIPDAPPYLTKQVVAYPPVVGSYDPHNPGQYWVSPVNSEMYRWDGKRSNRFAFGEPHRIFQAPHDTISIGREIIQIPKRREQWDPQLRTLFEDRVIKAQYFHHGFNCWVGRDDKPLAEVLPSQRALVIAAMTQRDAGNVQTAL